MVLWFQPGYEKIAEQYASKLSFEVLSGGMIISDQPKHISAMAGYIQQAYKSGGRTDRNKIWR
jgi:hypothetical protein